MLVGESPVGVRVGQPRSQQPTYKEICALKRCEKLRNKQTKCRVVTLSEHCHTVIDILKRGQQRSRAATSIAKAEEGMKNPKSNAEELCGVEVTTCHESTYRNWREPTLHSEEL